MILPDYYIMLLPKYCQHIKFRIKKHSIGKCKNNWSHYSLWVIQIEREKTKIKNRWDHINSTRYYTTWTLPAILFQETGEMSTVRPCWFQSKYQCFLTLICLHNVYNNWVRWLVSALHILLCFFLIHFITLSWLSHTHH